MDDGIWLCSVWIVCCVASWGMTELCIWFSQLMRWRRETRPRGPAYWDAMLQNERSSDGHC